MSAKSRIFIAAGFALLSTNAWAANLANITEYAAVGVAQGTVAQIAAEPRLGSADVNFAGGATQSAAFNAATSYVRVICDTQCAVTFGTNPTATTTSTLVPALLPEYFAVPKGQAYKISVIARP